MVAGVRTVTLKAECFRPTLRGRSKTGLSVLISNPLRVSFQNQPPRSRFNLPSIGTHRLWLKSLSLRSKAESGLSHHSVVDIAARTPNYTQKESLLVDAEFNVNTQIVFK
jgi:hypothetical protein